MDHLPRVANPHRPIRVPYLGYEYAGHGFSDFPTPDGITIEALQSVATPIEQLRHAAPYLQARFCFGVLHETTALSIHLQDFVDNEDSDHRRFTTMKLSEYLRAWRAVRQARKDDHEFIKMDNDRLVRCLNESHTSWKAIPKFGQITGREVELSIQLLACAIENAAACIADIDTELLPWRRERSDFVFSRMLEDGWCPSLAWKFGSSSLTYQYFASLLPAPRSRLGHSACIAGGPCSVDQLKTTDEDNASQHICAEGSCPEIAPDDAYMIADIIRQGGIPLLEFVDGKLRVSRHEQGVQYTAISHVWTDGLGNPKHSRMPQCQLTRINESMKMIPWTNKCQARTLIDDSVWQTSNEIVELGSHDSDEVKSRPLYFWIDTICIPRDPELKRIAVNSMRAVYNRANRVLVFDADLTKVSGQLTAEEILTRISLSNWIRRFWTLQEAVLAKILWFRFGDECYRSMSDTESIKELAWLNEVAWYCQNFNFDWRSLAVGNEKKEPIPYVRRVTHVWDELKRRESSFIEDQPICIATLLDMDIDIMQQVQGYDARFKKLWQLYEAVPKRILFLPGPKLTVSPLRWAPTSFRGLDGMPVPPGIDEIATPTPDGLQVRHHALVSQGSVGNAQPTFFGLQVDEDVYLVRENLKRENPSWEGLEIGQYKHVAVLLAQNEHDEEATLSTFDWALGAMVGIRTAYSADDAEIKCEYLRTVSVLRRGSAFEQAYRARSPLGATDEQEAASFSKATVSRMKQAWLIE